MSVTIRFTDIIKKYGDNVVIPGLNLGIKQGEFFTLLGPSGCGKTTLLRMVAGFNSIEGGEIYFNDKLMNNLDVQNRNIGMVFQNYAIFPHMNVKKNVAFGLEQRHLAKAEIDHRVEKILDTVQIAEYKNRMPQQLSGGQQQRVALARAIVIEPDVLLMDEPLSNLDAKLRVEMRNAIKSIQKNIGITTIYVTHDQEEAMSVSDRIAIMKDGIIQQIGSPRDTYQKPANLFVATFIGRTNILDGKLNRKTLSIGNYHTEVSANSSSEIKVKVSVRPEELLIGESSNGIKGTINHAMFLGLNTHYFIKLDDGNEVEVIEQSAHKTIYNSGDSVSLKIESSLLNVFDHTGQKNLTLEGAS